MEIKYNDPMHHLVRFGLTLGMSGMFAVLTEA
jgi:hypothetical protein